MGPLALHDERVCGTRTAFAPGPRQWRLQMHRLEMTVVAGIALSLCLVGCNGDDNNTTPTGSNDASVDTSTTHDAGTDASADASDGAPAAVLTDAQIVGVVV